MKKIIGISANQITINKGPFKGHKQSSLNQAYISAVEAAGGIPILLPITEDLDKIKPYMEMIDGLLLSGGQDISPLLFNEQPRPKLQEVLLKRDLFESQLIEEAMEKDIPILALCRGHQLLNVALGGSLHQDLSYTETEVFKHYQNQEPHTVSHEVKLTSNSILYDIFKSHRIGVNSYHHLAIKDIAEGLMVTAVSEDGIIEGVEHVNKEFVVGVQWHPEMMASSDEDMAMLFKAFVDATERS